MSEAFQDEFHKLLEHDKLQFDDPTGWKEKALTDSILMSDLMAYGTKLSNSIIQS